MFDDATAEQVRELAVGSQRDVGSGRGLRLGHQLAQDGPRGLSLQALDDQARSASRLRQTGQTPFDLTTTERDGLAVVSVVGELDCATAPLLGAVLGGLADPGRVILVDLSDTEFLDCAGVGVLANAYQHLCQLGGALFLDSPRREVSRVLRWTQLDRMITILHGPKGSSLLDGCSPLG